ncbi:MAG TPA: PLDc N-terminal domain-containing protein [Candidatus Methanoperedens sp.]|nr:PLDc N-terminal domain-containing protein [Candidatus Methanoperedens sp.]HLB70673.1 PLDc N-terminal domain-containing protein [Candidatus Methanoperedens sp.]
MIGSMELFIILVPAAIMLIFWIWMLIDCLKRDDDYFAIGGKYAKLIWVVVIIFAHIIGAFLYFFLIKERSRK